MSVAGFDLGDQASCIAVARKRGIDVLLNKESKRETPAVVSFSAKNRLLGTDAAGSIAVNPQNAVQQIKRLLGKRYSDPAVQRDVKNLLFAVTQGPDDRCGGSSPQLTALARLILACPSLDRACRQWVPAKLSTDTVSIPPDCSSLVRNSQHCRHLRRLEARFSQFHQPDRPPAPSAASWSRSTTSASARPSRPSS